MQVHVSSEAATAVAAGALVVPVFADQKLDGAAAELDKAHGGALGEILESGEMRGKPNETALFHAKDAPYKRILLVGLGEREKFKPNALAKLGGTAVRVLGKRGITKIAFTLPAEARPVAQAAASFVVEGAHAGTFETTAYRSEQDRPLKIDAITLVAGATPLDEKTLKAGAAHGKIIGEAVNLARTLALTPANDMTPTDLADQARKVAKAHGLKIEVLDEDQMKKLGMGSLLCVSQGSDEPATLSVLTYEGDPSSKERIALVGKGLTFDSGGISIKPAENMHEMKYDMSGGAAIIATLSAIAALKPKLNVLGVIPSSENLPGPRAVKPGDVVKAMNGKTIEVINTDAEGRLILADALCYARKLGATRIVDCATLTGAVVIMLGHAASAAISNDDAFVAKFLDVANSTGERYWRMPLYEDYATAVKSEIADLRNSAGRAAGTLTAATFLRSFVEDLPWIHLDIAGTAYLDSDSAYQAKGPTGTPVRALTAFVEALAADGYPPSKVEPAENGAASKNRASTTNGKKATAKAAT